MLAACGPALNQRATGLGTERGCVLLASRELQQLRISAKMLNCG